MQFDKRIIPQLGQSLGLRICFSAGELQDAVVGAGGKAETVHRLLQQHLPCSINLAIFTHHSAAHLRIREQPVTTLETLFLDFPRRHHPLSDVGRERYFDSTIYLPVTLSWNPNLLSKLSIMSVDRTINFVIISFRV